MDPFLHDNVKCPLCADGYAAPKCDYGGDVALFRQLKIMQCPSCLFAFAYPYVSRDQLLEYYGRVYRSGNGSHSHQIGELNLQDKYGLRALSQLQLIRTFRRTSGKSPIFLDIGAGMGYFLHAAKTMFPAGSLVAVEPDVYCRPSLLGLGAKVYDFLFDRDSAGEIVERFDVVCCSHALEHYNADDLPALMGIIDGLLAEGGVFFVEVPNEYTYLVGDDNGGCAPHLSFFSVMSLRKLLERHFEILFCDTNGPEISRAHCRAGGHEKPSAGSMGGVLKSAGRALKAALARGLRRTRLPILAGILRLRSKLSGPEIHEHLRAEAYAYGGERVVIRAVAKSKRSAPVGGYR